jgi:hypothetical protein
MRIDFTPLSTKAMSQLEFAAQFSVDDLRAATNTYFDEIEAILVGFNDAQLIHEPNDPNATDNDAKTAEEVHMGWSLAHLVLHVTASAEEGAAISSMLARGVVVEGRYRYEPDWRTVTTRQQVMQRLTESRRMVLAYLEAWPDVPHLDVYRKFAPDSPFANAQRNAPATFLGGLNHLAGHLDQFREVAEQARSGVTAGRA